MKCKCCGEVIESLSTYHFVSCRCDKCSIDGGKEYLKRIGNLSDFIEMCEYEEDE